MSCVRYLSITLAILASIESPAADNGATARHRLAFDSTTQELLKKTRQGGIKHPSEKGAYVTFMDGVEEVRVKYRGNQKALLEQWFIMYDTLTTSKHTKREEETAFAVLDKLYIPPMVFLNLYRERQNGSPLVSMELQRALGWLNGRHASRLSYIDTFVDIGSFEQDPKYDALFGTLTEEIEQKRAQSEGGPDIAEVYSRSHVSRSDAHVQERLFRLWLFHYNRTLVNGGLPERQKVLEELLALMDLNTGIRNGVLCELMGSKDERTIDFLRNAMWTIDDPERRGDPDVSVHQSNLYGRAMRNKPPPHALLEYLCQATPDSALAVMYYAYARGLGAPNVEFYNQVQLTGHRLAQYFDSVTHPSEVSTAGPALAVATAALESLMGYDVWFSHFYISSVLEHHPDLRSEKLIPMMGIREEVITKGWSDGTKESD